MTDGEKFLVFLVKLGFVVGFPFLVIISGSDALAAPYIAIVDFISPSMGCKSLALLVPTMIVINGAIIWIGPIVFRCVKRKASSSDGTLKSS